MATEDKEFENMFENLDESFFKRIEEARLQREQDREAGAARGLEQIPEGVLGRVSEELDPEYLRLLEERKGFAEGVSIDETMQKQKDDITRTDADYQKMISAREMDSPEVKAARESALLNIQRGTAGQLRNARGAAAQGGYASGGAEAAMGAEAMRASTNARAQLERDLLITNQSAKESLIKEGANRRATNINQLANLQLGGIAAEDAVRARAEAMQQSKSDRELSRQLYNQDAMSSELFGRLGVEETGVQMGVMERGGLRSELISEAGQTESARHSREMERIQEIEANKPPPSGGGKIICGVLHKKGYLSNKVYRGDLAYAKRVNPRIVKGYHLWAKLWVKGMEKSPLFTKVTSWLGKAWAQEMAYRVGYVKKGSVLGKFLSWWGEPLCYLLSYFKKKGSN